jgi:hypothetical protein
VFFVRNINLIFERKSGFLVPPMYVGTMAIISHPTVPHIGDPDAIMEEAPDSSQGGYLHRPVVRLLARQAEAQFNKYK